MTTNSRAIDLRESLESAGHDGICDSPGCAVPASYAIAQDRGDGGAMLAAYCPVHIDGPRVARREAVEQRLWHDVETRTRTWYALLAAYPNPLPLTTAPPPRRC